MRTYVLPTATLRRFESSGVEMDFLPVATDGGPRCDVGPGTLVIWEKREVHQTWAATPMLAVIVETAGRFDVAEGFEATELPRS